MPRPDAWTARLADYCWRIRHRLQRRLVAAIVCCAVFTVACTALPDELTGADEDPSTSGPSGEEDGDPSADEGQGSADQEDGGEAEADDEGSGPDLTPASPTITEEELTERLAELAGTLAVGNRFELSVVRPDGSAGALLDGSESVLASQPTWSRDGSRLAWSSVSADRQVVLTQDFGQDGEASGERLTSPVEGQPVFYLQWNNNDERLVYIRNSENQGLVEIGIVEPGTPGLAAGEGAPFFVSWGPESDRIVGHVNERSIDLFTLDDGANGGSAGFDQVLAGGGGFSAPAWITDDRVVLVFDGQLASLDIGSGVVEPIADVPGDIRFVLSPDRTKLAYQTMTDSDGPSLASFPVQQEDTGSSLIVLDLATGQQTLVTNRLAVAWEWSPDSKKLAWLQASVVGGRPLGAWSFWADGEQPATTEAREFNLSGKYGRNYLPFFAQYTQSVTGWSPDSTAFAFAGAIEGDGGIWVQLITEVVAPRLVAPGDFVTWGSADVPLPDPVGPSAA